MIRNKQDFTAIISMLIIFCVLGAIFMLFITGCTYNISMAHTEGVAEDVIDDNQTAEPDISPNLTILVKSI